MSGRHPFEEVEAPHDGWHIYHFNLGASDPRMFKLTTIAADNRRPRREATSIVSAHDDRPFFPLLSFDGVLSVEAVVTILRLRNTAHEEGRQKGVAQNQRELRKVIGL